MEARYEENFFEFRHPTRYRVLSPPDIDRKKPRPVLLALHGMGMDADKFQRILRHLESNEMLVVVPEGMYPFERRVEGSIEIGYAWYLYRGDQEEFHEQLERSERHLLALLDKVERDYSIDRKRSVVLGFSQGGYLAGFMGLRNRDRFGGLVIASARLKHEFLEDEIAAGNLPDTLFLHSEQDKATKWDQAKEGLDKLTEAGATTAHYLHEDGHRLPPDAVVRLSEWLGTSGFDQGLSEAAGVKEAWKALEKDDPEQALHLLGEALNDPTDIEARLVSGIAYLDLAQFQAARDVLDALGKEPIDADTEYLRRTYLGQSLYYLGLPDEAIDAFSPLEPGDPIERANLAWWKGLCFDHLGKSVRADDHFAQALKLDPENAPRPVSISIDAVEAIIEELSSTLPEPLQAVFEEVPVVVQDLPPRDVIRTSNGQMHPDTLGLYSGSSLIDQSVFNPAEFPPTIYIYRRNLERFAMSEDDLRDQVRVTLLHELGHHLGYDEDGLDELGLA